MVRTESDRLLGVLALFVTLYVVVLYLTATLFDAGISVEGRLLVLIEVAGVVLVVGLAYRAAARSGAPRSRSASPSSWWCCAWAVATDRGGVRHHVDRRPARPRVPARGGPSPLGDAITAVCRPTRWVASTFPSTVYTASGHDVVLSHPAGTACRGSTTIGSTTSSWRSARRLAQGHGYLALDPDPPKEFATTEELARIMKLTQVGQFGEGALSASDGLQPGVR